MSLLDVLAPLPQFKSLHRAQNFIDELRGRGWFITLSRSPPADHPAGPEGHIGAVNEGHDIASPGKKHGLAP